MVNIKVTSKLLGTLGESYYKEYCDQKGLWAYCSVEFIDKVGINDGFLEFKQGFLRFQIKIPESIIPEINRISKPRLKKENSPSYVFDFLACKIGQYEKKKSKILNKTPEDFNWVEVKAGSGKLSKNQYLKSTETSISLTLCKIWNPEDNPSEIRLTFKPNVTADYIIKD